MVQIKMILLNRIKYAILFLLFGGIFILSSCEKDDDFWDRLLLTRYDFYRIRIAVS